MIYRASDGTLPVIAAAFTDADSPDVFRQIAAGRAAFRTIDLLALVVLLQRFAKRLDVGHA